ncbi:YciI family protein [Actinosynnema sp. NPDC059797]
MTNSLWVVHCLDAPGAAAARELARPAHSARLRASTTRPACYGPLVGEDGRTPVGSLIVLWAADRAEVERWVAEDPFTTAGVWGEVRVHAFAQSANSPNPLT